MNIFVGVFMLLHGVVHLLYVGHSAKYFEIQPGMAWPDGSWAFSRVIGDDATRLLTNVLLVVAAIGFAAAGVGLFARQDWWRPVVAGAAAFSAVVYFLLWNGKMEKLDGQGWVGILINAAILLLVLVLRWPEFDF